MKRGRAGRIVEEVLAAVARWPSFAAEVGVAGNDSQRIAQALRLDLPQA
jgi:hypothetical protein